MVWSVFPDVLSYQNPEKHSRFELINGNKIINYRALLFAIYHLIYINGSIELFFQSFIRKFSSDRPPSHKVNIIITINVLCIFRLELGIFNNECHIHFTTFFFHFMNFIFMCLCPSLNIHIQLFPINKRPLIIAGLS